MVRVGEVGGDEEDVVFVADGALVEETLAGVFELVVVAGGEDEEGSGAGVALGECVTEATGGSSDDDDLARLVGCRFGKKDVGGGGGEEAGSDACGVEGGGGLFHVGRSLRVVAVRAAADG